MEKNVAPVDRCFIPLYIGFQPSKVVQDFFHQPYRQEILCMTHWLHTKHAMECHGTDASSASKELGSKTSQSFSAQM
jgi:hypothetical protein